MWRFLKIIIDQFTSAFTQDRILDRRTLRVLFQAVHNISAWKRAEIFIGEKGWERASRDLSTVSSQALNLLDYFVWGCRQQMVGSRSGESISRNLPPRHLLVSLPGEAKRWLGWERERGNIGNCLDAGNYTVLISFSFSFLLYPPPPPRITKKLQTVDREYVHYHNSAQL